MVSSAKKPERHSRRYRRVIELVEELIGAVPELGGIAREIEGATAAIIGMYEKGGTLFLAGNGGSMSDAQHIAGELSKSFECARPIPERERRVLERLAGGKEVAGSLERGLPAMVLGLNHALSSAISNDFTQPGMEYAQELYVFGKPGDVFLGVSTSGNARNVINAMMVARLKRIKTILLTGKSGGRAKPHSNIAICAPSARTCEVQQYHERIYHMICLAVERYFFC